ncbi:MAG: sugar phosphate isomerase/epimerase family protein [Ruminiclostridium sp.]
MKLSVFYQHIAEAAKQRDMDVEEVMDMVREMGISAVELDYEDIGDVNDMRFMLDNADLEVSSVYCFFDFGHFYDREKAERFISAADMLGAEKVLCVAGFLGENDDTHQCIDRMVSNLRMLCDYAEERGITVTVEDFDDKTSPFSNYKKLLYFLKRIPNLGITFDTGNFLYSDIDELEAFDKLADRIVHVHCKDRSFAPKSGEEPKATISGRNMYSSPVGSGVIKMAKIIDRLEDIYYEDYLVIEHFGSKDQLSDIEKSAAWLNSALFNMYY